MSEVLSQQETQTLRTAAFGAVMLVSVAYPGAVSTTKINIVGARVLSGGTGLVGKVLSGKVDPKLPKGTAADVALVALPALRESVSILEQRAPEEVENFRRLVSNAVDQGASSAGLNPATADMIVKVKEAMGAIQSA
jgi:hypothetical protein